MASTAPGAKAIMTSAARSDSMLISSAEKTAEIATATANEPKAAAKKFSSIRGVVLAKREPVIAPIALGFDGEYYNINGDEMASACAVACHADALVFLTDVPGVKGADGNVLRWLSIDQIAEMAKSAIISGGMLPKLGACREALLNGVKRVRILPAEAAGSLPDLCSSRVIHGTEVMVA